MKNTFKQTTCKCCNKSYHHSKYSKNIPFKIIGKTIKRLTDNIIFKTGDIIRLTSETGSNTIDVRITDIDIYKNDKTISRCVRNTLPFKICTNTIKGNGSIYIDNKNVQNADLFNSFRFMQHINI